MKGSGNGSLLGEVIIKIPPDSHPLSQVPLQKRYETLDLESQPDDLEENDHPVSLPIMINLSDRSPPLTSKRKEE